MDFGASIRNTDNHILVSTETFAQHFAGDAVYTGEDDLGNTTKIGGVGVENASTGQRIFNYRIELSETAYPTVFIKPVLVNQTESHAYGLLRQEYVNNGWELKIICQGASTPRPERVLIFVSDNTMVVPHDDYGMVLYNADGKVVFDSSRRPLGVIGAVETTPPLEPTNYGFNGGTEWGTQWGRDRRMPDIDSWRGYVTGMWKNTTLDRDMLCNESVAWFGIPVSTSKPVLLNSLAFAAPSLAQQVSQRKKYAWYEDDEKFGTQHHLSDVRFWIMFQNVAKLRKLGDTLSIGSCWAPLTTGFYYYWEHEGTTFGGGGTGGKTGSAPYIQKAINMGANLSIIVNAESYVWT